MKQLLLLPLMGIAALHFSKPSASNQISFQYEHQKPVLDSVPALILSTSPGMAAQKMAAAVFKSQEFCRVEMKDFDFDAPFVIKSAAVYFSGANFPQVVKGSINSSSLNPISNYMKKCRPGSVIFFDDIRVIGPDKLPRVITGVSITLF